MDDKIETRNIYYWRLSELCFKMITANITTA